MPTYNLDEEIAVDDEGHVPHHIAVAVAVNDLDVRVENIEAMGPGEPGTVNVDSVVGRWNFAGAYDMGVTEIAEGEVYWYEDGGMKALITSTTDAGGRDFTDLFPLLEIGSKYAVYNISETGVLRGTISSGVTPVSGGAALLSTGVTGSAGSVNGSELIIAYGVFAGGEGGGGGVPTLDEVLNEGAVSDMPITIQSGDYQVVLGHLGATFESPERIGAYQPDSWSLAWNLDIELEDGDVQKSTFAEPGYFIFSQAKQVGGMLNLDSLNLSTEELPVGEDTKEVLIQGKSGTLALLDDLPVVMTAAAYAAITPVAGRVYIIQG